MTLEEYLGVWQLRPNGRSVPIGYTLLCREIEKLDPDAVGHKVVQRLETENYVATQPNGTRILTMSGLAKRVPLPVRPVTEKVDDENTWVRFRRLCAYYADCVTQSEKQQEYLFADGMDNVWMLPVLDGGWITAEQPLSVNFSRHSLPAINRIKARRADEEDVYVGYPLSAFHDVNGKMVYSPILLFPVDVFFDSNLLQVTIRQDEVDINRAWLEFNVPRDEQKNVQTGICFSEGEKTGLLDTPAAIQYLSNRFHVDLNPDLLDYTVTHRSKGIVNSAALFVGSSLKYSKTLKKELRLIAKQSAAVLNQTALAYVFRDPTLENRYEQEPEILPFDFLPVPSNREQFIALEEALNRPVSKVTGPPGTGKSQVAVNLIANLVFNGLSVLFTSKNHKAVHAIYERADEASRVDVADLGILPLVQFCTTPQGEAGATWWQQRLDMERERFAALKERAGFIRMPQFVQNFADTLDNWRDWKKEMADVDATRALIQGIEARLEAARTGLPVPEDGVTAEYADRLRCLAGEIDIFTDDRTIWRKLLDILLFRKRRALNAEQELRLLLPTISREAKSSETLRKRVVRLCCAIHDFLTVREEASQLSGKLRDLPEDTKKRLAENVAFRKEHLKRLFLYRRIVAADAVPDELVQTLKNALSRAGAPDVLPFLSLVLNEDGATDADWAQGKFALFSKFFPAWATTLLSLSKAAPCIAGAFDRVVIDEASQCEIPPIIPALFRAKGVTVIGDPKQFPPVITLREARHAYVRHIKHKLNDLADDVFDFTRRSAFDVVSASPLLLREHFRCHADIADYFNDEYYGGKLKVRTNSARLKFPSNMGFSRALVWCEVSDSLEGEITEVKTLFRDFVNNNYGGEVGVISPFRKVTDRLRQELCDYNLEHFDAAKDVNTANGFQGGERDLIVFVLGYTSKLERGEDWYAVADANRYIYNVSVSRARACLIVVGDRERARQSTSSALRKLACDVSRRSVKLQSQSPGEEMLFQALLKVGLVPMQQHPLAGRYLDMALVDEKIDIEVDGEAWHLNKMGERKQDDIYRDLQIQSCGWRVCRFWYCEVRDNLEDCVAKVKLMVDGKRGR